MKNLKTKIIIVLNLIIATILGLNTLSLATDANNNPKYIGITELKLESGFGYAIGDPNSGGAKIWNLIQYQSETSSSYSENNIYCLKAGVGFENVDKKATYNVFYDMKTEKTSIGRENDILKNLVEGKITLDGGTTINQYSAILAALDLFYFDGVSDISYKQNLLSAATANIYNYQLTNDDIESVQQAALWYFTNYGEAAIYDQYNKSGWLDYTTNGTSYTSLSDYNIGTNEGRMRQTQAENLYNYLIRTAIANAPEYDNLANQTKAPIQLDTKSLNYEIQGSRTIIGPIHITENNIKAYKLEFITKIDNVATNNYILLNKDKSPVSTGTTIADLIGQDFYISLPLESTLKKTVSVEINISYDEMNFTLWTNSSKKDEQPIAIPEKEEISLPGKLEIEIPDLEGEYELEIVKQDENSGAKLAGAIFNVNGEDKTATNTSGVVNIGTIQIKNTSTPDTYTIKETTSPEGYNKFTGSIELNVAKKIENARYVVDTENTTMVVKDSTGATITENIPVTINKTTGKITITVDNEKITGNYELEIVKVDGETNLPLTGAVFNVNGEDKTPTNTDGILNLGTTEITGTATKDSYVIKETTGPDTYNKFDGTIELEVAKKVENGKYVIDTENTTMVVKDSTGATITQDIPVTIDKTTGKITITVENVKKEFDLALRKFIVAVSRDENIEEDEYLRNEDGSYSRAPVVDASQLNTVGTDGNKATTATYNHTKEPVEVRKGDTVIYTIRVYNESELSGYAEEITDYLPDELEFLPNHPINEQYEWTIEGNRVTTDYLSKEKETQERQNLIEAFDETRVNEEEPLYYKEVQIACKVKDTAKRDWKITNLAQITEDADKNGDETDDRDSTPDGGFEEPIGEERPIYKDDEIENGDEYIPGQEDDDDFEKVIVKEFDLALRKFIIAVSNDQTIEEDEYLRNEDGSYTREPVVDTSLLNTEDEEGNLITTAIYNHTKEPVLVQKNDIVIYMLRVYNEGDIDGYAAEIKDHLPPYLEYVDGEFNDQYGWEVLDDGRTLTTRYLENSLINKPVLNEEGEYELSYQEVPVMCRVIESAPTNENITNIADITENQDDEKEEAIDRDSEIDNVELPNDEDLPGYKGDETGEYIPGQQDDDDFEKVIVKEFDLALRKWVTEAIVIENGKETVTATGHGPYDDPEEIVKVELYRKNINDVIVKFRYKIRVTNEGDIPGYVKEITDYVPEGLRFDPADNPGWTDEGNNVISTTLTEDILLQPGEYTEVEVVLTWINDQNNMGVMTNIAEISEDDNEYDIPDRDSTPDNQKEGEDDIDDAPVMISISTGAARTYFMLGGIVLITLAGGIILIKKFVI